MTREDIIKKKKHYETINILSFVVFAIGFISFIANPFIGFFLFVAGGLFSAYNMAQFKKFSLSFKETYVKEAIKDLLDDISYQPKGGFTKEEVYSDLLLKKEDRFYSEDLITGRLDNKIIKFADLELKDVRSNGKSTTVVTVFKGKYIVVELIDKAFTPVYITENNRAFFGSWQGMPRIDFEWIEFNKAFDVFSKDSLEAFKLLTPSFMEKIFELKKRYGKIKFAFKQNKIIIAINNNKDAFDLKMYKPFKDHFIQEMRQEIEDIKTLVSIVSHE